VGINKLSMPSRRAFEIQQTIQNIRMERAVYIARRMLACSRIAEVEELFEIKTK
jgi:phosphoenolpyruvate-protein kinase (PTS system EI component)